MSKTRNKEIRLALSHEVMRLGGSEFAFGHGGKHDFIEFTLANARLKMAFTTTPGDHRYVANTLRDLRRKCREHLDRQQRPH